MKVRQNFFVFVFIIGIVSQKGGVGKSTISRAIAREAAHAGLRPKIADLDVQQSTVIEWNKRRIEKDIQPEVSVENFKTVEQTLKSVPDIYDILIVDSPARASQGTFEIAKKANVIIQPTGASLDDLQPAILTFHELVKAGIPKSKLVFALNRVGTEAEEAACREYINQAGYDVLEGCIFERPAYRQAQNEGYSITETKYSSLNQKADSLLQEIVERIANHG